MNWKLDNMTLNEEEELYVYFFEMSTSELISISGPDLTVEETGILYEVLCDRRDEIDQMLASLNEECEQKKKTNVKLSAEIVAKLLAWDAIHTSFLNDLTDPGSVIS